MEMKKIKMLCVTVLACFFMGIFLSACDSGVEKETSSVQNHSHEFSAWITTSMPACETPGILTRTCSCGFYETSAIEALEHTPVKDEAVEATCAADGLTEGVHCSLCNAVLTEQTKLESTGHVPVVDEAIPATCILSGKTEGRHCEICNEIIVEQVVIDALGHTTVTDEGIDASCTEDGMTEGSHCSVCGEVLVEQTVIRSPGHTLVTDAAVPATCLMNGKTEGIHCGVCGEVIVEQTVTRSTGHTPITDVAVPATCLTNGKTEGIHCGVCGEVIVAQTLTAATGHSPVTDWAIPATCTANGKGEGSHCGLCGTVIVPQITVAALQHSCDRVDIVENATCVKKGTKKYSCTRLNCSYSYTEAYELAEYTPTEIYNQALMYVGEIHTYDRLGSPLAQGTGFVYSSDGQIITNYHVIEEAYSAQFILNGVTYSIQSVLAYDASLDLAVLKINATGLVSASVCMLTPNAGETVYAIGSPRGMTSTITQGIVTYANRVVDGVTCVQHDASITNGNSGGPLINKFGEVIGINTWLIKDSQNLNFAVFAGELFKLKYSSPLTMAEFYEKEFADHYEENRQKLVDYLILNGEYNATYHWYEVKTIVEETDYISFYSLTYFMETGNVALYLSAYHQDIKSNLYVSLNEAGEKWYTGECFSDSISLYKMEGYIISKKFTKNTLLGYRSYEGASENEEFARDLFSTQAQEVVNWFNWYLKTYDVGLTIADFGFVSYEN